MHVRKAVVKLFFYIFTEADCCSLCLNQGICDSFDRGFSIWCLQNKIFKISKTKQTEKWVGPHGKTPNFNRRNKIKFTALSTTTTASALNQWKWNEKDYQWDLTLDSVMVYKSRQTPRVHHDKRLVYWRDCHWRPISSENAPAVRLICASFCVEFW